MSWMNTHLHVQFNKLVALLWLVLLELIKIFLFPLAFTALLQFTDAGDGFLTLFTNCNVLMDTLIMQYNYKIYHWEQYMSWAKLRKEITWTQPFVTGINLRKGGRKVYNTSIFYQSNNFSSIITFLNLLPCMIINVFDALLFVFC